MTEAIEKLLLEAQEKAAELGGKPGEYWPGIYLGWFAQDLESLNASGEYREWVADVALAVVEGRLEAAE